MKILTKYHGEIEVKEQAIWNFEKGIPGFPSEQQFVFLPLPENEVFAVLQSVKTESLAFVIASPFTFFHDYEFKVDDNTLEQLNLDNEADILVYTILTVQNPFDQTTANLQAPLILNKKNHKAKQLILTETAYKTKHSISAVKASKG